MYVWIPAFAGITLITGRLAVLTFFENSVSKQTFYRVSLTQLYSQVTIRTTSHNICYVSFSYFSGKRAGFGDSGVLKRFLGVYRLRRLKLQKRLVCLDGMFGGLVEIVPHNGRTV
jgi:hypothetical protein